MLKREGHTITGAFVFLLLGIFAVAATIMVLMGVRFYRSQTLKSQEVSEYRILSSYVRTMLRSRDEDSLVGVDEIDGIQMLTMSEEWDGIEYVTRIYAYDGSLREWFSEAAYEFEPERGEKIFDARDFRVQTDGDLIIATLTDTLGQEVEVRMSMRSKLMSGETGGEFAKKEIGGEPAAEENAGALAEEEIGQELATEENSGDIVA